ncbi:MULTISPECIES: type II toxin-antitoxin system Phd/YefM family antitoxin [unclassified Microbacterium]|uniref:type II toxin-antitoxin system Phd/YefM family antitoxin n=1 Tax=unclassified Microbacterium TaxID=2609290 RepID=UPI001784C25C|nr:MULTISPECIES: type II toxin-antitoxin system Phd/YefM family antitoxin [unclassified Microbacterium]MBD8205839.1 type II toxin-antitoxin system Phd/YefM family antitoxin [Microbacterium sp. CFBP 8801]MBD8476726.1 type II toxin-antitoxin system Phd/YefM family antitoxin [Microbacterium sp. CFBP 8794]MBD8509413.1 type II toxin-antitoxin system Phd/YefM family antitoxin [Microbacterium sp. CFBP 8790]
MTRVPAPGRGTSVHRLAIEAARGRLSTVVDSVQEHPVLLTRRGRPVAAVITMDQYEVLIAAEARAARHHAPVEVRGVAPVSAPHAGGDAA